MPDVLGVEAIVLVVLCILLASNIIAGCSSNAFLWPVVTLIVACGVVVVALAVIASQTNTSWIAIYYWRYSYLGLAPLLIFLTYFVVPVAPPVWQDAETIRKFVAIVLIFWLLGWIISIVLLLVGIAGTIFFGLTEISNYVKKQNQTAH